MVERLILLTCRKFICTALSFWKAKAQATKLVPSAMSCSAAATSVFETGNYTTVLQKVESVTCSTKSSVAVPPPKPLLIATPCEAGEFPLLIFLHGYLLYNSFYSLLIQHVASHGFIVIAPQVSSSLNFPFSSLLYAGFCF